jgi:hypothetical protein
VFGIATVEHVAGTVSWPVGIDLDPDVLHGERESASIPGRGSSEVQASADVIARSTGHDRVDAGSCHNVVDEIVDILWAPHYGP